MEVVLVLSGLLVGLAVGFLVASRRRGQPASASELNDDSVDALQSRMFDVAPAEVADAGAVGLTGGGEGGEPGAVDGAAGAEMPAEAVSGPSPQELLEEEVERLRSTTFEQGNRIDELESQLRRLRRWAGQQLQRSAEQIGVLWKQRKLPTRVHEMGRELAPEVVEELRHLAEPLGDWSHELGLGGAEIHSWLGLWHALEGRPAAAVDSFEQALRKGIEGEARRETQLALGDALWLLDRRKKARDAYRQVLDRKRVPGLILHRCAQVAFEERSYQEVLAHLDPILERKQTPLEAFIMASEAAGKLGDHARAVALCEAGLNKHPDIPILFASMVVPLARLGQRERMQEVYERARELSPELAEAPYALGVVRLDDGDLDGASELMLEALALRPDYPEAHFSLGVIHNRRGEFRKALEHFDHAVRLKPEFAEAYYNMKDSYDGLRDFESSIAVLKRAVQLNPEYR